MTPITAEQMAELRALVAEMADAIDEALPFIVDDTLESVQIDGGPRLTRADIARMCSTAFDKAARAALEDGT